MVLPHAYQIVHHQKVEITNAGVAMEKKEPLYTVGRILIDTATMEKQWRILKKLKIEPPHDPAIPLLGIYPKEVKTLT